VQVGVYVSFCVLQPRHVVDEALPPARFLQRDSVHNQLPSRIRVKMDEGDVFGLRNMYSMAK
jgi:hypothetical protein